MNEPRPGQPGPAPRASVIYFALLAVGFLTLATPQASLAADPGAHAAPAGNVTLVLKISDEKTGLSAEVTKVVAGGSNALDVLRNIVMVKVRAFPDLGPYVTSLCGVEASEGFNWTFSVDGKWSDLGIASVKLEKDTVIEWKIRQLLTHK